MQDPGTLTSRISGGAKKKSPIITSVGAAQPLAFLDRLAKLDGPITVINALGLCSNDWIAQLYAWKNASRAGDFGKHLSLGPGPADWESWRLGNTEFMPTGVKLFPSRFGIDSPFSMLAVCGTGMDSKGRINLGPSSAWTVDLVEKAQELGIKVIVEMNPNLPSCVGNSRLHKELVELSYEASWPCPEYFPADKSSVDAEIGKRFSELVPDGATLSMAPGGLVEAALLSLETKKDLGVYSEFYGDAMMRLEEAGVINNHRKGFQDSRSLASYLMGSRRLYRFAHKREGLNLVPLSFLLEDENMRRNRSIRVVCQAAEVDLAGQVSFFSSGVSNTFGLGMTAELMPKACLSEDGLSIVLVRSTKGQGKQSSFVACMKPPAGVNITADGADIIISEYGQATLRGLSGSERARALIKLAHPDHRTGLFLEAEKNGIL